MDIAALMPGIAGMPAPAATPLVAGAPAIVEAPAFEAALLQALGAVLAAPRAQPKSTLAPATTEQETELEADALFTPTALFGTQPPVEIMERAPDEHAPPRTEMPASEAVGAVETEGPTVAPAAIAMPVKPATASAPVATPATVPVGAPAPVPATVPAAAPATTSVERSPERLDPVFRTRLDRVVERMRDEFGIEVRVVETYRSQERQNRLYEQGRTEPGPTVTWTRHSNHTQGRAADVQIVGDGGTLGYARLARVAAEEGLRTLGPADPGHIEMKGTSAPVNDTAQRASHASAVPRQVTPSGVARVAEVARVARVAQVARVAPVVQPGAVQAPPPVRGTSEPHSAPNLPVTAAPVAVGAVAAAHAKEPAGRDQVRVRPVSPSLIRASDTELPKPRLEATVSHEKQPALPAHAIALGARKERVGPVRSNTDDAAAPTSASVGDLASAQNESQPLHALVRAETSSQPAAPASVEEARGADIAARVARVLKLHDAAAEAPTTGMTLMLDDVDGATARIRLDVRGNSVGTRIDMADSKEATDLGNRVGELRRALERQGLEPAAVTVREVPGLRESKETVRTAVTGAVHDVSATTGNPRSGDGSQDRPTGQPRREQGAGEDRPPRRNQKEERK